MSGPGASTLAPRAADSPWGAGWCSGNALRRHIMPFPGWRAWQGGSPGWLPAVRPAHGALTAPRPASRSHCCPSHFALAFRACCYPALLQGCPARGLWALPPTGPFAHPWQPGAGCECARGSSWNGGQWSLQRAWGLWASSPSERPWVGARDFQYRAARRAGGSLAQGPRGHGSPSL